jgi:hypothetical protein
MSGTLVEQQACEDLVEHLPVLNDFDIAYTPALLALGAPGWACTHQTSASTEHRRTDHRRTDPFSQCQPLWLFNCESERTGNVLFRYVCAARPLVQAVPSSARAGSGSIQTTTAVITRATAAIKWDDQCKKKCKKKRAGSFKRAASFKYKICTLPSSLWLLPWSLLDPACQIYGWGLASTHWYCRSAALKCT